MKAVEVNVQTNEAAEITLTDEQIAQMGFRLPTYAELRASEYPSFADQFDVLFHEGFDAWKAVIQAVKDKYPKPDAA